MQSPEVQCFVDTCVHWMPGALCDAGQIAVLSQRKWVTKDREATECDTFLAKTAPYAPEPMEGTLGGPLVASLDLSPDVAPDVLCAINTCVFWRDGDQCTSDTIQIIGRHAEARQDTQCRTFVSRTTLQ